MAASKKQLRAKRARARWRERRGYDLRPQYWEADLPTTVHIAAASIEDPYAEAGRVDRAGNLDIEARLGPVRHRDGTKPRGVAHVRGGKGTASREFGPQTAPPPSASATQHGCNC